MENIKTNNIKVIIEISLDALQMEKDDIVTKNKEDYNKLILLANKYINNYLKNITKEEYDKIKENIKSFSKESPEVSVLQHYCIISENAEKAKNIYVNLEDYYISQVNLQEVEKHIYSVKSMLIAVTEKLKNVDSDKKCHLKELEKWYNIFEEIL